MFRGPAYKDRGGGERKEMFRVPARKMEGEGKRRNVRETRIEKWRVR